MVDDLLDDVFRRPCGRLATGSWLVLLVACILHLNVSAVRLILFSFVFVDTVLFFLSRESHWLAYEETSCVEVW
jgi:hypothetical protein